MPSAALAKEIVAMREAVAAMRPTSCSSCRTWPNAKATLVDDTGEHSLLGPTPWSDVDKCPDCDRSPSWSLRCVVVDSIAASEAVRALSRPNAPQIALTRHQGAFLRCESKTAVFIGGLGAGKSVASALWLLLRLVRYPRGRHFVIGTTYAMLKGGTHITLRGLLDDLGWSYVYNRSSLTIAIAGGPARGAEVQFWSSETFSTTKGLEVDSCVVEELAEWQNAESAFAYITGRLRQSPPSARNYPELVPSMRIASNPPQSLSHFVYEAFVAPPEDEDAAKARPTVFLTRTLDNPLIPQRDEYVAMLRATMSTSVFRSQVMGEFVEIGASRVYERFQHRLHVKATVPGLPPVAYDPKLPIVVGLDFGPRMGAAALMQVHRLASPVRGHQRVMVYVVDEIAVENSYTQALLDEFERRYPSGNVDRILFYGDATGERVSGSGAGEADWAIVRKFMQTRGYVGEIKKDTTNPLKIDRTGTFNFKLQDTNDDVGILVAPHCKVMVKDLTVVKWKDGVTRVIDHGKSGQPILSHMSDAASYFVAYEFNPRESGVRLLPNANKSVYL